MNNKVVLGVALMLVILISTFSFAFARENEIENEVEVESRSVRIAGVSGSDSIGVDAIKEYPSNGDLLKIIYKNSDGSLIDSYKAHCSSVGGVFNECGSWCFDGENCMAVCAYTCENVPKEDVGTRYKVDDESEIEVKYSSEGSEYKYKIKYEGEDDYGIDTDLPISGVVEGEIKIKRQDGTEYKLKIKPSEAVVYAFGSSIPGINMTLEEKNYSNVPAVVYKIDTDHEGKFLGLFKIKARYEAAVDSSNGDVLEWNGPWWAFLITGEPEKPIIKEKNKTVDDSQKEDKGIIVTDFKSCIEADGVVEESVPRVCIYKETKYTEVI